ncbi:hypothetical protein CF326_g4369 [Tilletia indica]|nr:hypothetical protein CF326_g4369 [Tilletia indica]
MADTPSFHSDDEATVGRFARLTVQNGMKVSKSASKILHELDGRPATAGPFLQTVLRGVSRLVSVVEDPANFKEAAKPTRTSSKLHSGSTSASRKLLRSQDAKLCQELLRQW